MTLLRPSMALLIIAIVTELASSANPPGWAVTTSSTERSVRLADVVTAAVGCAPCLTIVES